MNSNINKITNKIVINFKFILLLMVTFYYTITAANETALKPKQVQWPFNGVLGKFDQQAAQRGFQIYKEVCSACHEMKHTNYRNLQQIGFGEDEVKAIAAQYQVKDYNDLGEQIMRPAKPFDKFVAPFANEAAARAANNGALPVDLSLIIKAREDGANYVYSLLTGYTEKPKDFHLMDGLYYNQFFPGRQLAMPQPLNIGQVVYQDGTTPTIEQMAHDVVVFLQWAAEPEMENRKSLGLKVMIYFTLFTVLFYIAKKRIWANLDH